jgi:hypothetical protein
MNQMTEENNGELFRYSGPVYFRPIGRGICFERPFVHRGEERPADSLQFEEMFDGDYEMEVVIRRRPEPSTP